jgi:hypothetical protein
VPAIFDEDAPMMDIIFVLLALGFFAASIGLVYLFERLREHKS